MEGIDLGATGRTVRVNGDAEVLVTLDEAVLRLGVETLDAAVSVSGGITEPVAPGQIAVRAGVAVTFALGAGDELHNGRRR